MHNNNNNYSSLYEDTMKNIRENIKGNKIWVSIDETTDSEGIYVANVIIGTLNTDAPGKTYLITTGVLEKANYLTNYLIIKCSFSGQTEFVMMTSYCL